MQLGKARSLDYLLVGRVRAAVADVLAHCPGKHVNILLDDADIAPQRGLSYAAHVLSVNGNAAVGHVVKPHDQLADRGLAAAGRAYERERFAGLGAQRNVVQHLGAVVGEAHVVERDIAADAADINCVRGIDDLGLGAHDLKKALEAGSTLHVDLGKLRELAHGVDEGRNVKREGYEVYVAEAAVHDQHTADGNDHDGHDASRELHAAHERTHGFVVFLFRAAVHVVCRVEFLLFKLLVGKRLGRAHAGNAVFKRGVDDAHLALDLHVRILHLHAALEREPQAQRQQHRKNERQLPVYREHDEHRADDRQRADDDVFRAVVGKLGDLEQIAREPAHKRAGAVFVIKAE